MTVIILENGTEKLRGILTRWMIETKPGVFVGSVNSMVREKIWKMVEEYKCKGATMIYSCNTEQGYDIKMLGNPIRKVIDFDGIKLIKVT